ncbi:MAG: hypothetical protein C7B47_08920 [Sulfobacillus thermosulfidooxidans]|uniref:Succinylglutamate desuccinylase/Aspartoacylase catalytic domain-containing protein n=1 Tax=Sulfobacillus thermosulfidooxidans TaxID=28034 RepID=A0A2T2WY63_SULTH|nr:MAG: hypothetical protein C7B47_08920 [Sulfobacillus thermosulfidooxidans]
MTTVMKTVRKTHDTLPVPGTDIVLPYTRIEGESDGPTLLVTGGVHGGEYPGIEASIRFAQQLDPSKLHGRVVVIHITNPPAFYEKTQYIGPLDGKNLNRVFPGKADGTVSERIAHVVTQVAETADYWVDLHGGDIHEALIPFTIYSGGGTGAVVKLSRAMAEAYGIPIILESDSVVGGSYAAASHMGIPAILTEAGQVGQLDENAVSTHLRGLNNLLATFGFVDAPVVSFPPAQIMRQFIWTRSPHQGLFYRYIQPGQTVHRGDIGGILKDAYGTLIEEVLVPQDGLVLFTATSLAINQDDPLFAVASE